ncbi:hypothetical protein R6Q59_015010 [Mikania micrantha]
MSADDHSSFLDKDPNVEHVSMQPAAKTDQSAKQKDIIDLDDSNEDDEGVIMIQCVRRKFMRVSLLQNKRYLFAHSGSCTHLKSQLIQLTNNSIHLTRMTIHDCPSVESFPDIQLPNLTSLAIRGCKNLKSFPDIKLPNLTGLTIEGCQDLKSFPDLPLMNLTLLTQLTIRDCPSIDAASFPGGNWPNLVFLDIGGLKKPISEWGSQNFPASLVELHLWNEPQVRNFSQLSHLLPSSLKHLQINKFDKLESLSVGLQHLTSLRHLRVWKCPKMKHLPETLLSSLSELDIYNCPILTRRGSHYRPLISHIPHINIEDYKVQLIHAYFSLSQALTITIVVFQALTIIAVGNTPSTMANTSFSSTGLEYGKKVLPSVGYLALCGLISGQESDGDRSREKGGCSGERKSRYVTSFKL